MDFNKYKYTNLMCNLISDILFQNLKIYFEEIVHEFHVPFKNNGKKI